jgi:hypothetical protein
MIRFQTVALALAVAAVGCSEHSWPNTTGPDDVMPPGVPALAQVSGVVIVNGTGAARSVQLRKSDGALILIIGTEAARLASVAGGEVTARGTWDAPPSFVLDEFQVLSMNGRAAYDGTLTTSGNGFALRLASGTLRAIGNAPAELANHLGERLWIAGLEDPPVAFGVIAPDAQ